MCFDPVTLGLLAAGAALSAGGAVVTHKQEEKSALAQAEARNRELQAFRARQKMAEDRNRAVLQQTIDKFDPAAQQQAQAEAVDTRNKVIEQTITPESGSYEVNLGESAPKIIKDDVTKSLRDVFLQATDRAKLMARPLSYSDMIIGNNLNLVAGGRPIDTQNSFTRQEAAMLPSMQDLAAYAVAKPPSPIGKIMQAAGSVLGGAAGSGMFRGASSAAAAAPTNFLSTQNPGGMGYF